MTVSLKHTFQSAKTDSADATLVQPSNWNQEHVLTAAAGKVLGRDTSGNGVVQELPISVTSAGNVTIPNNFAVTGTTGLTGTTTLVDLTSTGTASLTNLNATGTVGFTNALAVTSGGTGAATLPANNVLIGNGTSAVQAVAPGATGNLLTSNGTTWLSSAAPAGVASSYTEFLASGTWTKPSGITWVFIEAIGGGGGGSGAGFSGAAAGGGGGGGYASRLVLASSLGATETVTIGAGGAGGTSGNFGANGGNTTFGSFVTGPFGRGGANNSTIVTSLAGADTNFNINVGTNNQQTYYYPTAGLGGVGASSVTGRGGNTLYGGAGGGGTVATNPGGSGGISQFGGNGGNGNYNGAGFAGSQPGGGGGGGGSGTFIGGAGGDGRVRVWAW